MDIYLHRRLDISKSLGAVFVSQDWRSLCSTPWRMPSSAWISPGLAWGSGCGSGWKTQTLHSYPYSNQWLTDWTSNIATLILTIYWQLDTHLTWDWQCAHLIHNLCAHALPFLPHQLSCRHARSQWIYIYIHIYISLDSLANSSRRRVRQDMHMGMSKTSSVPKTQR